MAIPQYVCRQKRMTSLSHGNAITCSMYPLSASVQHALDTPSLMTSLKTPCPDWMCAATECGGGRVPGDLVPVHAASRIPSPQDLHPDDVQRAEGAAARRHREPLCGPSSLWPAAQGTVRPEIPPNSVAGIQLCSARALLMPWLLMRQCAVPFHSVTLDPAMS